MYNKYIASYDSSFEYSILHPALQFLVAAQVR